MTLGTLLLEFRSSLVLHLELNLVHQLTSIMLHTDFF